MAAEYIQGGSPPDVALDSLGRVAVHSPRQWARDASVRIIGAGGCSGTLVSPRVVLTAAHCVRPVAATDVWFSPLNPDGDRGEIVPGTPAGVTVGIARCEIHPERDGACGDGFDGGGIARENDFAIFVLNERFDSSPYSRYPVIPAQVVENDPGNVPEEWILESVWMAGYGREGLFEDSGINRMRLVAITHVASVFPRNFFTAHQRGNAGDSGGGIFVFRTDDGSPLQILGVLYSGNGTASIAVRLTASGMQRFLGDFLGAKDDHYPGAMVTVGATEVWTGGQDLPRAGEPGRFTWRDPETGQAPDDVDPDRDGLRGRHDNCWGIFNPRQEITDVSLTRTCVAPSTGETFTYGCAPRPAVFDGLGTEGTHDRDGDGIPDVCDNCPDAPNRGQRDCDGDSVPGSGGGDVCAPDRDEDGFPDACDTCPDVSSPTQRNCNLDAELALGEPVLGNACDPTPCGETEVFLASPSDDVEAVTVNAVGGPGRFRSGFRFCPCSAARGDTLLARDRCQDTFDDLSGGCAIADFPRYDSGPGNTLSNDYRTVSLEAPALDAAGEVMLTHSDVLGSGFRATWRFNEFDRPRYETLYPGIYPDSLLPTRPVYGVLWTQVLDGDGFPLPAETRSVAAHYWSGLLSGTLPELSFPAGARWIEPVVPLIVDNEFCIFCGREFPIPWLVLPCTESSGDCVPAFDAPLISVDEALVTPGIHPAFDPAGLSVFGLPTARWAAAAEPRQLLGPGDARYLAVDSVTGEPIAAFQQSADGVTPFGGQPCGPNQCEPFAQSFGARSSASRAAEADSVDGPIMTLSGREGTLFMAMSREHEGRLREYRIREGEWVNVYTGDVRLGRVLALAWSPVERLLYVIDEVRRPRRHRRHRRRRRHRRNRFARLLRVDPYAGTVSVEARWPRLTRHVRFALRADEHGDLWVAASRAIRGRHVVLRLTRGRRGTWRVAGIRSGRGVVRHDLAYANARGISLAVREGSDYRIVDYRREDLVGWGRASSCF